mmetsp:Transcript_3479/g.3041  ORF Transcript_3479/g.3041 Transcript_3479/m.3041 type:complete len:88 (+) Transcript_3479:592-855(+)
MLSSIVRAPVSFFDKNPVGRILNRFSNDIGVLDRQLNQVVLEFSESFLYIFSLMVVASVLNPLNVIPSVLIVLASWLFYIFCKATIR